MAKDYKTIIKITDEEKNKIIDNSPKNLPLNPSAQGYSGAEIRKRLYQSTVGEDGSLLALLERLVDVLTTELNAIETDKADVSYADSGLSLKADKTYVDSKLGLKTDKTYVDTELDKKVDKTVYELAINDLENNKLSVITFNSEKNTMTVYVDTKANTAKSEAQSYADTKDASVLLEAKAYTDTKIADVEVGNDTGYTETDPLFTAWDKSTGISITKSQVSDLITATQSLSGLMSATDKQRLDVLHSLLEEDTENSVVDSINEVLAIFNNYPEGADLVSALAGKVDKVTGKGLSTNDLTNTLKSNYDTAYSWGNHAVEGYLKAITKAMVETVLTGTITSHNHTKAQVGLSNVDNTSDLDKPISTAQQTALDNKVDKVTGKALSTNDYTNTDKQSVEKIPTIEQDILDLESDKVDKNDAITAGTKTKITYDSKGLVTSGADLEATDIPTLPASKITQDANNRFVTDTEKSTWNGKQNALTAGDGISISGDVISADGEITVETWSTATKTLALSDANKLFLCASTSDQTLTIPTHDSVPLPIGTMITFLLTSTYTITFSGQSGIAITSMDGLVELKTQYGMASLIKVAVDTWQLVGALE